MVVYTNMCRLIGSLVFIFFCGAHAQAIDPLRFALEDGAMLKAAATVDDALEALTRQCRERELSGLEAERIHSEGWMTQKDFERRKASILAGTEQPPLVSDEIFVRRAYLDITGCIPEADAAEAFLKDAAPDKRLSLIDKLLLSEARGRHFFNHLASVLRLRDDVAGVSQKLYVDWVRHAASSNMRYSDLVYELITARGALAENAAVGYFLRDRGVMFATAEETVRTFLGVDIACARCHDHPFCDATQKGYYEFAALFSRTQISAGESPAVGDLWSGFLTLPEVYYYRDGKALEPLREASVKGLGLVLARWSTPIVDGENNGAQIRGDFAVWLTSPDNRRFAGTVAWQMWERFFGGVMRPLGRVDVPDSEERSKHEMRTGKCEAYPSSMAMSWLNELLDIRDNADPAKVSAAFVKSLTDAMVLAKFDLRDFERVLLHTRAYQRECAATEPGGDPLKHAAPRVRRLSAEQMWDSMALLSRGEGAVPVWACDLPGELQATHGLRRLGRGRHELALDSQTFISHDVAAFMQSSELVKTASGAGSRVMSRLSAMKSRTEQVDAAFLAVLSRYVGSNPTQANL